MCVCNVEARSWHQASSSITLYLAIYLLIFFLSSRCIGTLYRPCCPQTHSDPLASAGINGVCQYTWCYCIFWGRSSLNLELTNSARLVGHWAPGISPPPQCWDYRQLNSIPHTCIEALYYLGHLSSHEPCLLKLPQVPKLWYPGFVKLYWIMQYVERSLV